MPTAPNANALSKVNRMVTIWIGQQTVRPHLERDITETILNEDVLRNVPTDARDEYLAVHLQALAYLLQPRILDPTMFATVLSSPVAK